MCGTALGKMCVRKRTYLNAKTDRRAGSILLGLPHTAMTMQRHERKLRMQHSHETQQTNLLESLKEFLTAQSLQTQQERLCSECGAVMQYIGAAFWFYGTDSQWNIRMPVCNCALRMTPPVRALTEECSMSTGVVTSQITKAWSELYKVALFETDKSKLSERIADAQTALALRARELFHTGHEHLQERKAVDAAIYALYVLAGTISAKERKGIQTFKTHAA